MSMFIQTIGQLNKRGTLPELDEALAKAIQQVRLTGKPASLVYQLKIKPQDTEADTVTLEDSITVKTANPLRRAAIFFTTEDGRISRNDPNQPELPMHSIEGGQKETASAEALKAANQ